MKIIQTLPMTGKTSMAKAFANFFDLDDVLREVIGPDGHRASTNPDLQKKVISVYAKQWQKAMSRTVPSLAKYEPVLFTNHYMYELMKTFLMPSDTYLFVYPESVQTYLDLSEVVISDSRPEMNKFGRKVFATWAEDYLSTVKSIFRSDNLPRNYVPIEMRKNEFLADTINRVISECGDFTLSTTTECLAWTQPSRMSSFVKIYFDDMNERVIERTHREIVKFYFDDMDLLRQKGVFMASSGFAR